MNKGKHTTKRGPGRIHKDGVFRNSLLAKGLRPKGNKIAKAAFLGRLGLR